MLSIWGDCAEKFTMIAVFLYYFRKIHGGLSLLFLIPLIFETELLMVCKTWNNDENINHAVISKTKSVSKSLLRNLQSPTHMWFTDLMFVIMVYKDHNCQFGLTSPDATAQYYSAIFSESRNKIYIVFSQNICYIVEWFVCILV